MNIATIAPCIGGHYMSIYGNMLDNPGPNFKADDRKRFDVRATNKDPQVIQRLAEGAALAKMDESEFARQAINAAHKRVKAGLPVIGEAQISDDDTEGNPLLDVTVACGDPSEAREDATIFEVTRHTADELDLSTDDFWVRARGESMEGRGIFDEQMVLVSPLPTNRQPRRGQIALVRITDTDGEVKGTLKAWDGLDANGNPRLKNGEGEVISLGEVSEVVPIAIAKGILGALV